MVTRMVGPEAFITVLFRSSLIQKNLFSLKTCRRHLSALWPKIKLTKDLKVCDG